MADTITEEKETATGDSSQTRLTSTALQEAIESGSHNLPDEIVQAIAISNAKSIGEQPAILANLALANQIFNMNLAQQNLVANQQAMYQILNAVLAKCVNAIVDSDLEDPQDIESLKAYIKELFDLMHAQTAENIRAQQEIFSHCVESMKPRTETS